MFKKNQLILILILLLFFFLVFPFVWYDFFPFVFDMGRDMLWVRDIVILKKLYLIGPWGSLAGIFFGPLWYYLLSVPFLITKGDPKGSVFLVIFLNLITIFIAFLFGKKAKNERLGLIFAFLLSISPLLFNLSTFAFHANLLPLTSIFFLYSLYLVLQGKNNYLILSALIASLNFHLEPAAAIFTVFTFVIFIMIKGKAVKIKLREFLLSAVAFILPFFPQLVFELRHNFLQTNALLQYFKGNNESLGGKLPFFPRIEDRLIKFFLLARRAVFYNKEIITLILLFVVFFLVSRVYKNGKKKIRDLIFLLSLSLLVFFIGFSIFPPELKGWYLYGQAIVMVFLTSLATEYFFEKKGYFRYFAYLILFIFFLNNVNPIKRLSDFKNGYEAGGPELFKNQIQAIDWIYEDAKGGNFSSYVYTPPIYDYQYQYLFWWFGNKKYGYLPCEYSYQPGEKTYVNYKDQYLNQNCQKAQTIYLIIEPEATRARVEGWLGHFSKSHLEKSLKLPSGIIIEKRKLIAF